MNQKVADFFAIFMGVRKTLIMLSLILISVIFRIKNLITGVELVELLKTTAISFFAANSIERVGETVKHCVSESGEKIESTELVIEDRVDENGSEN